MGDDETEVSSKKPLFRDINADDNDLETTKIESLCMSCGKNGTTKMLLTNIAHYREVVLMSFDCEFCGYQNNEIQSAGKIEEKGLRYKLKVTDPKDFNRQIVKSDYTSVKIPHLDFEIPSQSQKGEVTTLEGILNRSIEGLIQDQAKRRVEHPEIASKIDEFVEKLKNLKLIKEPFVVELKDISGNCFVENPNAPESDPNCQMRHFVRKPKENHILGIYTNDEVGVLQPSDDFCYEDLQNEVLSFPTNCPGCNSPCQTNMKVTDIPYFKQVIIMATTCDTCGLRTNEVKSGGGVEPYGIKIEIQISSKDDLSRDILKSETCYVNVPEIALDVGPSTLGGKFTTVEGLLTSMRDQLFSQSRIFSDSQPGKSVAFQNFLEKFNTLISGEIPFRMILDDPAGNSYVQSLNSPDPDPKLIITKYKRSFEQNDDLGLNDIKTENYETS